MTDISPLAVVLIWLAFACGWYLHRRISKRRRCATCEYFNNEYRGSADSPDDAWCDWHEAYWGRTDYCSEWQERTP
jgi:hypothetical protein